MKESLVDGGVKFFGCAKTFATPSQLESSQKINQITDDLVCFCL